MLLIFKCLIFLNTSHFSGFVCVGKRKKSKSTEDARGRRNAIRMSGEYTVETVVVADADMVQYHGAEAAQRFLLTVMNMVGLIHSNTRIKV